jgi:hypothetical protein
VVVALPPSATVMTLSPVTGSSVRAVLPASVLVPKVNGRGVAVMVAVLLTLSLARMLADTALSPVLKSLTSLEPGTLGTLYLPDASTAAL